MKSRNHPSDTPGKTVKSRLAAIPRRRIIAVAAVVVLAAAGLTWYLLSRNAAAAAAAEAQGFKTASVKSGDLVLSATGSGTLVGSRETSLSFPVDGTVDSVSVQAGDVVEAGQELARLKDIESLQMDLKVAQLELKSANQALQDVKDNATANLANAQLAVAEAEDALGDAKTALKTKDMQRCDQDTIDAYYASWMRTKDTVDALGEAPTDGDYYLSVILPAKNAEAQAYARYEYCARFTQYEIDASRANLTLAESDLKASRETLAELEANDGIDAEELARAENTAASAQAVNDTAARNLDEAVMKAPFAGTVLAVNGKAGDKVSNDATFITMADLAHPEVTVYIDEADLDMVSIGASAEVAFDSFPDQVFTGEVTQIDPSLQSHNGYSVLQCTVSLDLSQMANSRMFLAGLSATVDIIGGEARNAVLAPIEALRDLGDGTYGVFVIGSDGKARLQVVEVGLMDATYAEITSGLSAGDIVSTGNMETF